MAAQDTPDFSTPTDVTPDVPLGGSESTGGMSDQPPPQPEPKPAPDPKPEPAPDPKPEPDVTTTIIKKIQEFGEEQAKSQKAYNDQASAVIRQIQASFSQPLPQVPQPPGYSMPPDEAQMKRQFGMNVLGYLAVALPLAVAMGSKGGWAMAGAWGGLGRGLSEVVAGNNDQAEKSFNRWRQIQALGRERFGDQLESYKAVLANRDYSIKEMTDLIGAMSKIYGDKQVFDSAQQNMWLNMLKYIAEREEKARAYDLQVRKIETGINRILGKPPAEQQDYDKVIKQRAGMNGTTVEDEMRKYPFTDFLHEFYQEKKGSIPTPGQLPYGFQQKQSEEDKRDMENIFKGFSSGGSGESD